MTHNHIPATLLKTFVIAVLAALIFTGTAAAAGSLFIDTTGLTGKVDETTQVPVKITGANSLYSFDLKFHIDETDDYKIVFNEDSMFDEVAKKGFIYNQESGKVTQINLGITGDKTLFYLDVTPKTAKDVELAIISAKLREGTVDSVTLVPYTVSDATLTVEDAEPSPTPSEEPSEEPTVTPSPTPSPPPGGSQGGSSGQPSVIPTTTPTLTPTPTETVPTTPESETYVVAVSSDGSADFAESPVFFSVTLPEDHPGTVELTTNIDPADIAALAGKEIYHAAEITLDHPLAPGETALVHFMVPLADLTARGLTAADVRLYHHDHDGLTALPTVYQIIGDTVYYESTATEFSPFIIVFEKGGAVESIEPVKTPAPTETETPKSAGFGLLAVMAGLGVFAVLRKE